MYQNKQLRTKPAALKLTTKYLNKITTSNEAYNTFHKHMRTKNNCHEIFCKTFPIHLIHEHRSGSNTNDLGRFIKQTIQHIFLNVCKVTIN